MQMGLKGGFKEEEGKILRVREWVEFGIRDMKLDEIMEFPVR